MNQTEIDSYVKAGEIAKQVKAHARSIIKPGVKLIDVALEIDKKIAELGAVPAFPCGLSVDEIAAHFTPEIGSEAIAKGVLCVDIGVAYDGYIADTAFSLDLSEDGKHKEMIELNNKVQDAVRTTLEVGKPASIVGDVVQDTIESWNKEHGTKFTAIKSLSGHEIARNIIHAGMTVLNIRNTNPTILEDMAIAVEPFVTSGAGDVYEGEPGGIYIVRGDGTIRDRDARKVLEFIKSEYGTRPFCRRWLDSAGFTKLGFILSSLVKQGILYHYPVLIEKSKAPVSQVENTYVFTKDGVLCTTYDGFKN